MRLVPASALALLLAISPSIPAFAQTAAPPAEQFVGRWGFVSYWREEDQRRSLNQARAECGQPYSIDRGPNGGIMLHGVDATQASEVRVVAGEGRLFLIPLAGDQAPRDRRELRVIDANTFLTRFLNEADHLRYGWKVYARCGARR